MSALVPLLVLLAATPARAVTHPKTPVDAAPARSRVDTATMKTPGPLFADAASARTDSGTTKAPGTLVVDAAPARSRVDTATMKTPGPLFADAASARTASGTTKAPGTLVVDAAPVRSRVDTATTKAPGPLVADAAPAGIETSADSGDVTALLAAPGPRTAADAATRDTRVADAATKAHDARAIAATPERTRADVSTTKTAGTLVADTRPSRTRVDVSTKAHGTLVADASVPGEDASPRKVVQASPENAAAGTTAAPVPDLAPTAPPTPAADSAHVGRFAFGSYGRVAIGSDLLGQLGRSANVVAHGPRLIEDPYAELELRREDEWGDVKSRMVATMAFFSPFFHFSGDLAQNVGLRNLYFEAQVGDRFSAWAGSRMYRGDDVYLLNFWPLDNLNTIGGGASLKLTDATTLKVHAGMQRLDNTPTPYQYQVVLSDNPLGGVGSVSVARLNRPRLIESVKLSHELHFGAVGARVSAYAEAHQLGAGVERDLNTGDETGLPADWGVLGGAQLSVWGDGTRFAHLWVRHARGLAAYDALEAPVTFNNHLTTQGANSTRVALAGGWDTAHLGVLVGGYVDLMRDAGVSQVSAQKYDEGSVSVRGQWYATKYFGLALEGSYQRRTYGLVDEATGQRRSGGVTQLGVMPYFAPLGQGLFARPQVRLVYALSLRDAGARSFYAADDVFSQRGVEHYVGVSVEWWFNSSTYPVR